MAQESEGSFIDEGAGSLLSVPRLFLHLFIYQLKAIVAALGLVARIASAPFLIPLLITNWTAQITDALDRALSGALTKQSQEKQAEADPRRSRPAALVDSNLFGSRRLSNNGGPPAADYRAGEMGPSESILNRSLRDQVGSGRREAGR